MTDPARIQRLRDWYEYSVVEGVNPAMPGIYEWRIEAAGSYIGKYGRIRRPTREYSRNVARLLAGVGYRASNLDGFRRVHRELANAYRECRRIELIILENADKLAINQRETELIKERGNLNGPLSVLGELAT